jgi:hypothetical protein
MERVAIGESEELLQYTGQVALDSQELLEEQSHGHDD